VSWATRFPAFELAPPACCHSQTNQAKREIEGGEVGTRFDNHATEHRLELTPFSPLFGWPWRGGAQTLRRDFEACR